MWYEALPSFAIIAGVICVSGLAIKGLDRLFHDFKVSRHSCIKDEDEICSDL